MFTYQDFQETVATSGVARAVAVAIETHLNSDLYRIATVADKYDAQENETMLNFVKLLYNSQGGTVEDFTASNNKICSNFFHRLNTQRCMYSLGNGVSFSKHKVKRRSEEGIEIIVDETNERLGDEFDIATRKISYKALIHGVCFGFWNLDKLYCFPVTQFAPLWDEETSALRSGVRFWRLDKSKPMIAVLYEEDGFTKFKAEDMSYEFVETQPKRQYNSIVNITDFAGEEEIGGQNYSSLPIKPMWGSELHQSTLVGMRSAIDAYDLIKSGFANDVIDCAQIYWIISGANGMSNDEIEKFRDTLKLKHIALADTENSSVTPYTQEVPYGARKAVLDEIRNGIYEDFGGLDVHTVAAGATNDHIDAAYQPLDEEASDFEYQVTQFIMQILGLIDVDDVPVYSRNRISNQSEQVSMVMSTTDYLDDETVLQKLPFVGVDEIPGILARKDMESESRFGFPSVEEDEGEPTPA